MPDMAVNDSVVDKLPYNGAQHLAQIVMSFLFFEWMTHQLKIWIEYLLPRCKSSSPLEKDSLIARYYMN